MHPLNRFFDKIYCINLIQEKKRKIDAQIRFDKIGLRVEFFNTVRLEFNDQFLPYWNKYGLKFRYGAEASCAMSHYSCLKLAYENGYKNVLIFEDDVVFIKNFNDIIPEYLKKLPDDWQVFNLYSGIYRWNKYHIFTDDTKKIFKTTESFGCIAYGVNRDMMKNIIDEYDKEFDISDNLFAHRMQQNLNYKFYSTFPNLCAQPINKSTINPNPESIINVFPYMVTFDGKKETDYE